MLSGELFLLLLLSKSLDASVHILLLFVCFLIERGNEKGELCPVRLSFHVSQAGSSENLRQYGLSQIYSHPVLVTRTRSCPLVAPPQSPPVPRWKRFRQKKKNVVISDSTGLSTQTSEINL